MDILLSARARDTHADLIEPAAPPGTRWLTLDHDGAARLDGAEVDLRATTPEVAWMTSDIVQGGPSRKFFGLLTRSESVRWLQSSAAGFDHPIFEQLVRRGVRITPSHVAGPPIADYVLRAALDHLQDAESWRQAATRRRWAPHEFVEAGSTHWVIVGLGSIGVEVARRARACGAKVTGVRRAPDGTEPADAMATLDQLPDLLPSADIVVLALPSSPATVGIVDVGFLSAMSPTALLVNVGRGALVDEEALLRSLDAGRPARAVLDVTATEPLPDDHPLWQHPKVVVTPHSSALGDGRHRRAAEVFAENLRRYESGEPLLHEVTEADLT